MDTIYLDQSRSPEERADDLLSRLTLEEKIGQTIGVFMPKDIDDRFKQACKHGVGSVSTLEARNMTSLEQVVESQKVLQSYIMENNSHHIPAIFHMEGLCGAFIQGAMSFPSGIGRGSSFDTELEEQIGQIVARQERAAGITHTFAPLLDISRDSRLGRMGETYGEDPTLVASLGCSYTRGIQSGSTYGTRSEAVAKHFLGFHNSEAGIHGATSNTTPRLLREIYGKPFQAAISKSGLQGIMPCYSTIDGEATSVSRRLLNDLLRDEMGFEGLCVADYGAISNAHKFQRMYESFADAGYHAMEAGMDMELPVQECYNEELTQWFREGRISMDLLDLHVRRVLISKFRMGIFEQPFALEGKTLNESFYQEKDREVSLRSAEESMILLKNNGILPLKSNCKKIVIVGPHADNPRSFFGGYTHLSMAEAVKAVANSIAGIGEKANNDTKQVAYIPGTQIQSDETQEFDELLKWIKPECKSIYDELKERFNETEVIYSYGYPVAGNDDSHHEEALAMLEGADVCILTLGGKHGSCSVASMGEGVDSVDINLPECQDSFILKAEKLGVPLIGIHFNGRPISSDIADMHLDAILEAWNPSEMGAEAIINILSGKVSPSGKLPVSVAYAAGQLPLYYNHPNGSSWHQGESIGFANYVDLPHTPRYHFGFGLSYTSFEYTNIQLSEYEVSPDDSVEISFVLKNTGLVKGTEIVQLYIRDQYASMVRPSLELAGFRRVTLEPGEEKNVHFILEASQLAFLDLENRWKVEAGVFDIMIGSSSMDHKLLAQLNITQNLYIDGKTRSFWA